MDKNNYRRRTNIQTKRTTSPYNQKDEKEDQGRNLQETIINQGITSGIIIASVILISLIKTDFTDNIKFQLKTLLEKTSSFEDVKQSVGYVKDKYMIAINSVKTIFGGDGEEISNTEKTSPLDVIENNVNVSDEMENLLDDEVIKKMDRVDLDVLEELETEGDLSNEKKPIVPE